MKTCNSLSRALLCVPSVGMSPARGVIAAVVAWLAVGSMVGCGGGGGDSATQVTVPVPVEAPMPGDSTVTSVFGATLSGSARQDLVVVVRGGHLFGVYGIGASPDFHATGLFTSWADISPGLSSYNYVAHGFDWGKSNLDVNINLVLDASIPSISGTVTSRSETRSVLGGAIPSSAYNFNTPAALEAIRGRWDLTTAHGVALAIDIGADGVVTGTLGRCTLQGSRIKPSISGKNVFAFELQARSGNFACEEPGDWFDFVYGFALAIPSAGGGTQLIIGAENGWDPGYLAAAGKR